jgi:hypothetical protein
MSKILSASLAIAAGLAVSFAGPAEARNGGHPGHGPGGHIGGPHWGGHHGHGWRGPGVGFGIYVPSYGYYDDWADDDDCYRVRRHGRWRVVCR